MMRPVEDFDTDIDDDWDEEEVELFIDNYAEENSEVERKQWEQIVYRPKVITDNEQTLWKTVKGRVKGTVRKIAQSIWRSNAQGKFRKLVFGSNAHKQNDQIKPNVICLSWCL